MPLPIDVTTDVTRSRRRRGFTLMELMIVVAIIFIILAIAVPKYNQFRMSGNELAAIKMIQTIQTSQWQYTSNYGRFAISLQELGPPTAGQPSQAGAGLIPNDLAAGKKSGYIFQMQGTPTGYTLSVTPEAYNGSGRRSFYSDESMVVRDNWGPEPATASSKEIK